MKSSNENSERCSLCSSENGEFFFEDKFREYRKCSDCSLIFVPPKFHVSAESEKARYEEHNNDPDDKGYRDFLVRIVEPIMSCFPDGGYGLDFGCGPTTLLADLLTNAGFEMDVYDPFYAPDKSVFEKEYDFVVATEVVEHLRKPLSEFHNLLSILKDGGALAIMTRPYDRSIDFKTWHYKNDRTHICFYSLETFEWLSGKLGIAFEQVAHDIFVFENAER